LTLLTLKVTIIDMIKSFRSKETEKIWEGEFSKKLPADIQDVVRRKLRMLNNSTSIKDLMLPPSNMLEDLKGDRKGQYSIRVNKQWRICFEWKSGHCFNVEIVDYH
jgi:toxin HigB-1